MVIVAENGLGDTSSNLHFTEPWERYETLGKDMNPIILPPAMGRLSSLALVRQPVYEKEISEFKPIKPCLKIDLVSHTVRVEGLGKYMQKENNW